MTLCLIVLAIAGVLSGWVAVPLSAPVRAPAPRAYAAMVWAAMESERAAWRAAWLRLADREMDEVLAQVAALRALRAVGSRLTQDAATRPGEGPARMWWAPIGQSPRVLAGVR